ncbi:MAG: SIR2 family protein [Bryobacteraceae bacterium]
MFGSVLAGIPQRLVYLAAGLSLMAAISLALIAHNLFKDEALQSSDSRQVSSRHFDELWFTPEKRLAGAERADSGVDAAVFDPENNSWEERRFVATMDAARETWGLGQRADVLGWVAGGTGCLMRFGNRGVCATMPVGGAVRAVQVTPAGTLAVVRADGSVADWSGAAGQDWRVSELGVRVQMAASYPGYFALSTPDIKIYRRDAAGSWVGVESSPPPEPPFEIRMPGAGQAAAVRGPTVFRVGKVAGAPGRIRALTYGSGGALVAVGDFGGVHLLRPGKPSQVLAEASGALSAVCVSDSALAFSGPEGTWLARVSVVRQLNEAGQLLMRISWAFGFFSAVLGLLGLMLTVNAAVGRKPKERQEPDGPDKLPDPPAEMIEALCRRGGILWAGAGLSAQSGFPLWPDLAAQVIQVAAMSGWVEAVDSRRMMGFHQAGEPDRALADLMAAPWLPRIEIVHHYKAVYHRFSLPSRSHEALTRLPLRGVITTNYDRLLEEMGADEVVEGVDTKRVGLAERMGRFFVLKLYGDLRTTQSSLLCRRELYSRATEDPAIGAAISSLLERRTLIFVGASLEGLVSDLAGLGVRVTAGEHRHWAIAAVSAGWQKQAAVLERYGISTIACAPEQISGELPVFLEKLAGQCASRRQGHARSAGAVG